MSALSVARPAKLVRGTPIISATNSSQIRFGDVGPVFGREGADADFGAGTAQGDCPRCYR
jgi:hypothetical protein